ncbi:MAG: sortase B protein-sorting domain-containing protein [Lachnospiraceae bacterium]|nr:sortase B protein-sorting domain-containing protein [Lachnospiraceae bacterium]
MKHKMIASFSAVVLATSMLAVQVSASQLIFFNSEDTESAKPLGPTGTIQVNKPYLNITLDAGDIDASALTFTLKKDQTALGTFKGTADSFTFADDNYPYIFDITGSTSDSKAKFGSKDIKLVSDPIDLTAMYGAEPLGIKGFTVSTNNGESEYRLLPNGTGYAAYFDWERYEVVDTVTIPADQVLLDVCSEVANRGEKRPANIQICPKGGDKYDDDDPLYPKYLLKNYGGRNYLNYSSESGLVLRLNGGYNLNSTYIRSHDKPTEYVKIRIPYSDFASFGFNSNLTITHSGEEYPLIGCKDEEGYELYTYCFSAGGAITFEVPRNNGEYEYIEIWVNKDNPDIMFHSDYTHRSGGGGGKTGAQFYFKLDYRKLTGQMAYPESGITLYNLPVGSYTVEVDSEDYKLTGNTLKVTDTKDLQTMKLVLTAVEKAPEPIPEYTFSQQTINWTKGSTENVAFTVNRSVQDDKTFGLFTGVEIDGKTVDVANYTAAAGSLKLALKAGLLETLTVGEHTVKAIFADGATETTLNIKAAATPADSPAPDGSGTDSPVPADSGTDSPVPADSGTDSPAPADSDTDSSISDNSDKDNSQHIASDDSSVKADDASDDDDDNDDSDNSSNDGAVGGNNGNSNHIITSPKTGDESPVGLWFALLCISGIAMMTHNKIIIK